jgi:hypothetical protein
MGPRPLECRQDRRGCQYLLPRHACGTESGGGGGATRIFRQVALARDRVKSRERSKNGGVPDPPEDPSVLPRLSFSRANGLVCCCRRRCASVSRKPNTTTHVRRICGQWQGVNRGLCKLVTSIYYICTSLAV